MISFDRHDFLARAVARAEMWEVAFDPSRSTKLDDVWIRFGMKQIL